MQTTTSAQSAAMSLDDCVRLVTAADSFEELKNTLSTYAPKFYNRGMVAARNELEAQRRVVLAFNAWAERTGRQARAFIDNNGKRVLG